MKKILPLLISLPTFAIASSDYKDILDSGINYLVNEQVKQSTYPTKLKGEWASYMMNDHAASLLGEKGKKAWDSNCFTTAQP